MKLLLTLLLFTIITLPSVASAQALQNPLRAESLSDLIITVSRALIGLVAVGATFMFIYGGIMMLISGGNVDQVRRSKEVLKWTTISLFIIFLTGAILRFVGDIFGANQFQDVGQKIGVGNRTIQLSTVLILRTAIGLLGIAGSVMVIIGGYRWLTAGGNEDRVRSAKRILTAAIAGLVIILLAWALINYTLTTLNKTTTKSTAYLTNVVSSRII